MSSGNYQKSSPKNWFEHNRSDIIEAFNNLSASKKRTHALKTYKDKIALLHREEDAEWGQFRDECIKNEQIPHIRKKNK